jgi:hypothetical protein
MRGIHSLGVAILVCALSGVAAGHGQGKLEYRLTPLVVPTQFGEVFPVDITNAGVILGQPVNIGPFGVLFFGRSTHTFTVPGARLLLLSAMTTSGSVLVNMFDASGTLMPFLRSPRGGITPLTVDGTWFMVQGMDISENGIVVGYAVETPGGPVRGFVLDRSGTRLLDIPGGTYVTPAGVNAAGVIVGTAQDDQFTTISFIVDRAGRVKKLLLPGVDSTVFAESINDLGVIVGRYGDFTNTRGFVLRDNSLTTITYDAPSHMTYQDPNSGQTLELARTNQFTDVARINDWNQIVGTTLAVYSDDSGAIVVDRFLPFVGTPVLRH